MSHSGANWALIGCGDISRKRVVPALRDAAGSRLLSVSRARAELAEVSAREFGAEKHFADWREQVADPEVDAVYVATPPDVHSEQTIAAAEAGKHVLCEKPMALSAAECDRMIDACRAHGVRLGVAYYRRFYPGVQQIKRRIEAGEIGKVITAQINAFERYDATPGEPVPWRLQSKTAGGGPMMDFGSHRIEIFVNLLGALELEFATSDRILFEREVEDTSIALFRAASGARAQLTVTHAAREPQDTLTVYGSEGTLRTSILNQGDLTLVTPDGETDLSHPPHVNLHQPLVEDFIAALAEGREPGVSGQDGRAVQQLLDEIYRA